MTETPRAVLSRPPRTCRLLDPTGPFLVLTEFILLSAAFEELPSLLLPLSLMLWACLEAGGGGGARPPPPPPSVSPVPPPPPPPLFFPPPPAPAGGGAPGGGGGGGGGGGRAPLPATPLSPLIPLHQPSPYMSSCPQDQFQSLFYFYPHSLPT